MIDKHTIALISIIGCSLSGAPGAIPTRDLPLRRRTLYAAELREHIGFKLADALFECPETRPRYRFSFDSSHTREELLICVDCVSQIRADRHAEGCGNQRFPSIARTETVSDGTSFIVSEQR